MSGSSVPRDPNLTPEMRRFLDDLARRLNIFDGLTATEATALLNVFTSALKGLAPASGGGTTNFLRADATWAPPPSLVVQILQTTYALNADLATDLPIDDTVPLITEGDEVLSQAITPADDSNKVLVTVDIWGGAASTATIAMAVFRGTTCIAAKAWDASTTGVTRSAGLTFLDSPASASAQTYSVRVGSNSPNVRLNGTAASRLFGGASVCTLTLMEIAA